MYKESDLTGDMIQARAIVENVVGEGKVSDEAIELSILIDHGEITTKEAVDQLKERYK